MLGAARSGGPEAGPRPCCGAALFRLRFRRCPDMLTCTHRRRYTLMRQKNPGAVWGTAQPRAAPQACTARTADLWSARASVSRIAANLQSWDDPVQLNPGVGASGMDDDVACRTGTNRATGCNVGDPSCRSIGRTMTVQPGDVATGAATSHWCAVGTIYRLPAFFGLQPCGAQLDDLTSKRRLAR